MMASASWSEEPCRCCEGRGTVEGIDGQPRPCSRCSVDLFHAWAEARRPYIPEPKKERLP